MEAAQRAIAFMRALDERSAEEIRPFTWGQTLINRTLNLVHDANYALVDHVNGATARDLIGEADRLQADLGLKHRRVNVDDPVAADQMATSFQALGYSPERFVIMTHAGHPVPPVDVSSVVEVDWPRMRSARGIARTFEPWATPAVIEQLLAYHELHARLVRTRYFAVLAEGRVVSSCELRTEGEIAQIETVETLPEFRQRGFARAVVSAALAAAQGHDLIFLVADQDDWPQHFYARLGFQTVGRESRFLRLLE
jgi:ribosomal protein S18 acetylase RimI-like enzyme